MNGVSVKKILFIISTDDSEPIIVSDEIEESRQVGLAGTSGLWFPAFCGLIQKAQDLV